MSWFMYLGELSVLVLHTGPVSEHPSPEGWFPSTIHRRLVRVVTHKAGMETHYNPKAGNSHTGGTTGKKRTKSCKTNYKVKVNELKVMMMIMK